MRNLTSWIRKPFARHNTKRTTAIQTLPATYTVENLAHGAGETVQLQDSSKKENIDQAPKIEALDQPSTATSSSKHDQQPAEPSHLPSNDEDTHVMSDYEAMCQKHGEAFIRKYQRDHARVIGDKGEYYKKLQAEMNAKAVREGHGPIMYGPKPTVPSKWAFVNMLEEEFPESRRFRHLRPEIIVTELTETEKEDIRARKAAKKAALPDVKDSDEDSWITYDEQAGGPYRITETGSREWFEGDTYPRSQAPHTCAGCLPIPSSSQVPTDEEVI